MPSEQTRSIVDLVGADQRSALDVGRMLAPDRSTRAVRRLLLFVVALVAAFIVLAAFAQMEELARARGEIVPSQRLQTIQTQRGGVLAELAVRDGDVIAAGDLIARFRAADIARDRAQVGVRTASLEIDLARWGAVADGLEQPDLSGFEEQYPELVAEARSLFANQNQVLARQLEQKTEEIEQARYSAAAYDAEIPSAQASFDAASEVLERARDGVARGVIPANRLAEVEEAAAAAQRTLLQLTSGRDDRASRVRALMAENDEIVARAVQEARAKRAEILEQLAELRAEAEALEIESGDIEVRSPVEGIVLNVSDTPLGTVIEPGGTVAEIIPTEGGVVFEARVSTRDIGFVEVGQRALVKIDAFDFSRFGAVEGEVARVSPSSIEVPQTGAQYFLVEIALAQPFVGSNEQFVMTPGMQGEADIVTGEKSLAQYLLKPVFLAADTSFHER